MTPALLTVVETPIFSRRADALLTVDERKDLIDFLAANSFRGEEVVGTGGVRKIRFGAKGRGKSGGVRVIYYVVNEALPLFALLIYSKSEKADLTAEQRRRVSEFAATIKAARKMKGAES